MLRNWNKSLKGRIFFSIIFYVVLPFGVISAFLWYRVNGNIIDRQIRILEENADHLANLSNEALTGIKNASYYIYTDQKIMEILNKKNRATVAEQRLLNYKVSSIFFSNDDIESITFYVENLHLMVYRKRNESNRFYKLYEKEEIESYFLNYYDPELQVYSICMIKQGDEEYQIVWNQNIFSENEGLVRMEIVYNQDVFENIFSGNQNEDLSADFIMDEEGNYIYEDNSWELTEDLRESITGAPEGLSYTSDHSCAIIRRPMKRFPYYLVKCVSMEELTEDFQSLLNGLLVLLILILLFMLILSVKLTNLVTEPIRKFTDSIVCLRNNAKSSEIEIKSEVTEMNELAKEYGAMMKEINCLIEEKSEARYKEKRAFLKMLLLQMNPHFLYNTLQTLQFMALKRKAFEISAMLTSLGKILNYSLAWEVVEVSLEEELQNALEYLNVQKFRYIDELILEIERPEELLDIRVPKMILQPLVENCFSHGFKNRTGDYRIGIRISREDTERIIRISDNGQGMEPEMLEEFNRKLALAENDISPEHTGLQNMNYRLKQKYPNASVRIEQGEWFCIVIRIPEEKRDGQWDTEV